MILIQIIVMVLVIDFWCMKLTDVVKLLQFSHDFSLILYVIGINVCIFCIFYVTFFIQI